MQVITIGEQATLDGSVVTIKRNRFDRPLDDLRRIVDRAQVTCDACDKRILPRYSRREGSWGYNGPRWAERFDTPWQEDGDLVFYCSDACEENMESSSYTDFCYTYCDACGRYICCRNPRNGWHYQFRSFGEDGEEICLRCYQEEILASGQPEDDFAPGYSVRGGMFFDRGNPELVAAGYECLLEAFIQCGDDALAYNRTARQYIEEGYQLITAFESMAIGGLEGSIELWGKKEVK